MRSGRASTRLGRAFSGIFMFTVVSWLAEWQADERAGRDDAADLDARLTRSFDVFLDGCRESGQR
jgi:hypothetical protein